MLEILPKNTRVEFEQRTCDFHKRHPFKVYAGCTCSGSWSMTTVSAPVTESDMRKTMENLYSFTAGGGNGR